MLHITRVIQSYIALSEEIIRYGTLRIIADKITQRRSKDPDSHSTQNATAQESVTGPPVQALIGMTALQPIILLQ